MSAAESSSPGSPRGAADVPVAAGVEAALADVERQLARQASALRLVHSAPQTAATPVTLVAAPSPVRAPRPPRSPRPRRAPVAVVAPPAPPAPRIDDPPPFEPGDDQPFGDDEQFDEQFELEQFGNGQDPDTGRAERHAGTTAREREVVAEAALASRAVRRPVQRRVDLDELSPEQRAALGRLQARKVGRVVRDVSPWSVFKFSVLFWVCVWLILTIAGVILWKVGEGAGVVANIEKFYAKASGEATFEIDGRGVFRAGASIGALLVVSLTGLSVLIAVLFNLVTDLTGGIRLSVVELESTRRPVRARGAGLFRTNTDDTSADLTEGTSRTGPIVAPDEAIGDEATAADASSDAGERSPSSSSPTPPTPAVPTLVPESLVDDHQLGGDEPIGDDDAASLRSGVR